MSSYNLNTSWLDQVWMDEVSVWPGPYGSFAADEWMPARLRAFTDLVKAEAKLFARMLDVLKRWAARVRSTVFSHGAIDAHAIESSTAWFAGQLDDVEIVISDIFEEAMDPGHEGPWEPDALARVKSHVASSKNRLVRVPDSVYSSVRVATLRATTEGWSIDRLTERVDEILAESDSERWHHRAQVIARTEAIGAYNGGRYAGFQSLAAQLGGRWEKVWLATHDEHTRRTHARGTGADGQRVPLGGLFRVGEALLPYPGYPGGPPQEIIQCRCSLLMAREGEPVDLSNRHFRGLA